VAATITRIRTVKGCDKVLKELRDRLETIHESDQSDLLRADVWSAIDRTLDRRNYLVERDLLEQAGVSGKLVSA
jgi:hypothetical protein